MVKELIPGRNSAPPFCTPAFLSLFLWSLLSFWLNLDGFGGGWRIPAVLSQLFPAVLGLMAMMFAVGYVARIYTSRLTLGYFGVLLFVGFVVIRFILRSSSHPAIA